VLARGAFEPEGIELADKQLEVHKCAVRGEVKVAWG
jgi:hypothetical protein